MYLEDLRPASQQTLVVVHHVGQVFPVKSGLLLVQPSDLLVALPGGDHGAVKAGVVAAPVLVHGLAQTQETPANVGELSLVVNLTLGRLLGTHLGQVLHGGVKLGVELGEGRHLSVPAGEIRE